jgi:hypothetical protein
MPQELDDNSHAFLLAQMEIAAREFQNGTRPTERRPHRFTFSIAQTNSNVKPLRLAECSLAVLPQSPSKSLGPQAASPPSRYMRPAGTPIAGSRSEVSERRCAFSARTAAFSVSDPLSRLSSAHTQAARARGAAGRVLSIPRRRVLHQTILRPSLCRLLAGLCAIRLRTRARPPRAGRRRLRPRSDRAPASADRHPTGHGRRSERSYQERSCDSAREANRPSGENCMLARPAFNLASAPERSGRCSSMARRESARAGPRGDRDQSSA